MYKFTNGMVVFDEKTKDEYIRAGYKLIEKQLTIDETLKEETNENSDDSGAIKRKPKQRNKVSE